MPNDAVLNLPGFTVVAQEVFYPSRNEWRSQGYHAMCDLCQKLIRRSPHKRVRWPAGSEHLLMQKVEEHRQEHQDGDEHGGK